MDTNSGRRSDGLHIRHLRRKHVGERVLSRLRRGKGVRRFVHLSFIYMPPTVGMCLQQDLGRRLRIGVRFA